MLREITSFLKFSEIGSSYFYIEKWTFKMYISNVQWCFFTCYVRKVHFFPLSVEKIEPCIPRDHAST